MQAGEVLVVVAGVGLVLYALSTSQGESIVQDIETDVGAAVNGWQNENEGPTWVPVINQTEVSLGIPTNLLARMAFQESSFLPDVITGETPSSAGALGILQLEPQYNSSVQVPIPFTAADTTAQITQGGQDLLGNYQTFNDWGVAVAAYDAGAERIKEVLAGTATMPEETSDYVAAILTDVPVPSQLTRSS
jgi:soluble lytic murein transglycosylase-like protein